MKKFGKECSIIYCSLLVIGIKAAINCNESENCVNSIVLNALSANILNMSDPCDNFWTYSCGAWTPNPVENNIDTFMAMSNNYARKLQNLLENENLQKESLLWKKLRDYLVSCERQQQYVQKHTYGNMYFKALKNMQISFEEFEGWGSSKNQQWLLMIAELRQFGLNDVFLHESVDVASFDATLQVVDISMPLIDQSFESKQEILSYLQHIKQNIETDLATEVFELELTLRTLQSKQSNAESPERLLNLGELISFLPMIDWQLYFDTLMSQSVPKQLLIRTADVAYIIEMLELLNATNVRIIYAYILAKVSKYIEEVRPRTGKHACIKHMLVMWPLGMDYIYDRYLYETRHEDEIILQNILINLKAQFASKLLHVPLYSKHLNFMENKLESMQIKIGNLPLANTEFFEHYYVGTSINVSNFYENHWAMLRFRTLQQHHPLLAGIQQKRLPLATYVVKDDISQARDAPYYVHTRNLLIVPLVFLQLPFYHHLLHPMLHYSLLGWMLAHELQHAFDPDGILLNAQGIDSRVGDSIRNTVHYQTALQCLVNQLPPPVALAERMADVNGLQLAFDTYFHRVSNSRFSTRMPFASKKLFFLNMAQIFCGSLPTAIQHDRDDVRVVVSVANIPEFAAAFQCAEGTRENPLHRCHTWN